MLGSQYHHVNTMLSRPVPLTVRAGACLVVVAHRAVVAGSRIPGRRTTNGAKMNGPLIAASATMVAAWEVPKTPLADTSLDTSRLSEEVRRGFRIFTNTPHEAPRLAPGGMSCSNCHMNAGQREKSLPLVNVAGMFPDYNRRAARLFSLGDRITDCFLRSETAMGAQLASDELPTPTSSEVLAVSAYLTWLSRGAEMGKSPSWRGQNAVQASALVPVEKLDPAKGE